MYKLAEIRAKLVKEVAEKLGVKPEVVTIDNASDDVDAHLAIPCFAFASALSKSPNDIASELAGQLALDEASKIEAVGGYVNIYLKPNVFVEEISKDNYGETDEGKGKKVVVDFIGLNLAKPFSVGHLRPTLQGWAQIQIQKALGYEVIGDSHLGDWGTPFGMWVVGFEKYSSDEQLEKDGANELGRIYVKFRDEAEKDDSLLDEAKSWLKKLEEGDEKAKEYHERFNKISLDHAEELLGELGVHADENLGESFYIEKSQELVNELVSTGVAEEQDDGSVVVHLEDYGLDTPILLRKSDGSALYATSDLETARYRLETWSPAKIIYSVGSEQQFHFRQVFALADKLGYTENTEFIHAWFGLIEEIDESGKRGKMSSRKNTALLENLLKIADEKARGVVEEELSDDDYKKISVGAIKFNDFAQPRQTNILFDWDSMFSLNGHSSVYIQYAAVRVNSILNELERVKEKPDVDYDFNEESDLILHMAKYPETIQSASDSYEPYRIAEYVYNLAKLWNRYYESTSVKQSEGDARQARLWLLGRLYSNFEHALNLLGIQIPSKM